MCVYAWLRRRFTVTLILQPQCLFMSTLCPKKADHPLIAITLSNLNRFYRASICEGGLGSRNSVCPSVCLSVCQSVIRLDCDNTKWRTTDIFIPHEKGNHSATLVPTVVGERRPLPSEICAQSDPPPFEKRRLRPISANNVSTVGDSEKSSTTTNMKSTTRAFQRAIDGVRTLPLSALKGGSKSDFE